MCLPQSVFALSSEWDVNDHVETRLVTAVDGAAEQKELTIGLHFKLKDGWKIYWRSPGDAGFPPHPIWEGSENVENFRIRWPAPERFSIFDLETVGYKHEVLLPVTAVVKDPGRPVKLQANVRYLTCKEICIPYEAKLALNLPGGGAAVSAENSLIEKFAASVPGDGKASGLSVVQTALAAKGKGIELSVEAESDQPFRALDLFVEGPDSAYFGKPTVSYAGAGRRALIRVTGGGAPQEKFEASNLVLTLVDGGRAMETAVPARFTEFAVSDGFQQKEAAADRADGTSLLQIVLVALLGGLILNLMPCVLPVLSIKLLSAVKYGGGDPVNVRAGFLASACGIVVSLAAIGAILIAVRSAGMAVGWGIQFQQPVFLTVMAIIVTLFAYNLWGLFEVRLPSFVSDFAAARGHGNSIGAHFLTGVFATLLATPCSAPFVGTAVGFALSRGPGEILIVFTALGIGLAAPYLFVAVFPGMATRLPKPGNWMVVLRKILAVPLAATAVWLVSVLVTQLGTQGAAVIAAFLLLIGAVFMAKRLPASRIGRFAGLVGLVLSVAAVAVSATQAPAPSLIKPSAGGIWQPFDLKEVDRLVADGKTVLVDVTADWCITCQVNKKAVLDQDPIASLLTDKRVVAMRADWTRPNPAIAAYLARYGRYGIPFNVVYGPQAPAGVPLPELLTTDAVLAAIRQSGPVKNIAGK